MLTGCCGSQSAFAGQQSDFQQARTPGMLVNPGCRGHGKVWSVLLNRGLSKEGIQFPPAQGLSITELWQML